MSKWLKTTQGQFQTVALAILLLLGASNAYAEEQRCTELGTGCICSEPLQATSYPEASNDFKNPNDSTTKQCSQDGVTGGAVVRTADDVVATTDATAIAALPSGHSVARFLRVGNDHQGTFYVGNTGAVSASLARLAARWYIWHTPTFDFALEASCNNSKIAQFDNGALVDYIGGNFHTYNYLNFKPAIDCCVSGPGPDSGDVSPSQMKGKWWRFELVMANRSGPNFDLKMYGKNVTDNGPELTLIDLSQNKGVANLTPPGLMSTIVSNNHRFSAAGSCRGWIGISHYMMAGWTTNAGQRIGSAREIEGGGGGGPGPIPPPTNLKVSELFEELRLSRRAAVPHQLPPPLRSGRARLPNSG